MSWSKHNWETLHIMLPGQWSFNEEKISAVVGEEHKIL